MFFQVSGSEGITRVFNVSLGVAEIVSQLTGPPFRTSIPTVPHTHNPTGQPALKSKNEVKHQETSSGENDGQLRWTSILIILGIAVGIAMGMLIVAAIYRYTLRQKFQHH